jgi:hypothetical protein
MSYWEVIAIERTLTECQLLVTFGTVKASSYQHGVNLHSKYSPGPQRLLRSDTWGSLIKESWVRRRERVTPYQHLFYARPGVILKTTVTYLTISPFYS